ncbi:Serine/threonine-protein kinase SRPK [Grifola frondosa]|uniref:Serine/threonine-protein kinase SRPK n=1 Tax=Grifola frondosa TaxID=5627 RepID=A0A1C7LQ83_GRIFR|nr:Serine/threonine-protein kinase SRPK [Grifola frondosa]
MLNRILLRATSSTSRFTGRLVSCAVLHRQQYHHTPPVQTRIGATAQNALPTEGNPSTVPIVEEVELTFVEEPLGLRADQGYGYLQVEFGQRIGPNNRYEILRKLGWGQNASVWLARDHEDACYVAIKALTGVVTDLHNRGYVQELLVMERLTKLIPMSGQQAYCATLRSHFIHPGKPNDGEHLCLVMDVLAGDLKDLHEAIQAPSKAFPVPLAKLILRDTLRGLAQLHASGVAHTDLKATNIMCKFPDATSEAKLQALLEVDPSRRHPPEQSWDYPVEAAVSQPIPPPSSIEQALCTSFILTDFGSSQIVDHQVTSHITPDTLRAPESILQGPWDSKVDIWTFGCLIYEFMFGVPLFSRQHANASMDPDLYHLAQIIKFTGEEFSPNVIKKYELAPQFLDMETGYLAMIRKPVATIHFSRLFRKNAKPRRAAIGHPTAA